MKLSKFFYFKKISFPSFAETSPQNSPTRSWQFNAQLQSLAHQVVSYHFCQAENAPTCSVPEFIHSMASQLSQSPLLKPYYQLLVSNHKIRSRLTMEECLGKNSHQNSQITIFGYKQKI